MNLYRVLKAHEPGGQQSCRFKRGELVDTQRPQPQTTYAGWLWVEEDARAGWVPELLLGRVNARQARVLEDYDAWELSLTEGQRFSSLRQLAGWHYGHAEEAPREWGWVPDENLEKPALFLEALPAGRVAALCSAETGALPKFQVDEACFLEGLGMQGDHHCSPTQQYGYYKRLYGSPQNWRQVLITDTAIYEHLKLVLGELPYGATNENIVLDGILTKPLQIGQRIQMGEVLLEVSERRSPCKTLDAYIPGLMGAMLSYKDGKKVRDGGVLARVVRGGKVRTGDAAQVLPAV